MLKSHDTVLALQNRGVGLMPMHSAYRKLLRTASLSQREGWFLQSARAGSGGVSLWGRPAWWLDTNQQKKAQSKYLFFFSFSSAQSVLPSGTAGLIKKR